MAKLEAVEQELKQIAPDVETMVVQADFSGNANLQFYQQLEAQITHLDVGLLILNAGIATKEADTLGVCDPKLSQNVLDTNVYQVALLMKLLLPTLDSRDKKMMEEGRGSIKSGIIVTSSVAPQVAAGPSTQYASSKIFCNFLSEAVHYELDKSSSRVELTCLAPGPVDTKMAAKYKGSPAMVSAEKCVYKALIDMGRSLHTNGAVTHELISYIGGVLLHWCTLGTKTQ